MAARRLQPYARNAKTHGADQVAKIAASMAEFGWTVPCLVAEDGELIAGHGRILAAEQLGLTEAPVIVLGHLTEAQRRAYRLADNRLAESPWDEALLAGELQELAADDFDLSLVGFSDAELDQLLAFDAGDEGDGGGGEDVPEAPEVPVSRPGDLWLLGPHRLLCGDATVMADLDRLMAGSKADLCFTDSPYNVDYAGGVGAEKAGKGRRILNDALGDGFERFLFEACVSIIAHTAGAIYMCMSSSELHTLQKAFVAAGGHWSTFIIWAKDRFTLGRSDYQRQFEPILYGWPEGAKHHWCGARDQGDVWFIDRPHPQRPAPDDEAGRARRAGDPQLEPARGRGARPVRRQRHDADRRRADRARRAGRRARPEVRRCHRRALAGRDRL